MKIFIKVFVCSLILLLFIGCYSPSEKNFHTVCYNGHSYIVYNGYSFDGGLVHDPDCICHSKER